MQVGFKFKYCHGFGKLYEYSFKHTHMITKEAEQRLKILLFWKKYGLQAVIDAYGAKRSTLFEWWKIYQESKQNIVSLNPKSQIPSSPYQKKKNH